MFCVCPESCWMIILNKQEKDGTQIRVPSFLTGGIYD